LNERVSAAGGFDSSLFATCGQGANAP